MNQFIKQPAETYIISVDMTGKLPTGATITSGAVAAFDPALIDVSATILQSTVATIVGDEARVRVLNGTHGTLYRIRFRLTLSDGDLLEEDVEMSVENL